MQYLTSVGMLTNESDILLNGGVGAVKIAAEKDDNLK